MIRTSTCCGPDSWPCDWRLAGIELAPIIGVVLTHMHMGRIGGLVAEGLRDWLRADL